jgi:hypothetical protein
VPECSLGEIQTQIAKDLFSWNTVDIMKREAKNYSILDHDLLHGGYLGRLSHHALGLYLFLVVVGNPEGKNFYAVSSVGKILRMTICEVYRAKEELLKERLIDYQKPYWQVLTLTYSKKTKVINHLSPLVDHIIKKREEAMRA